MAGVPPDVFSGLVLYYNGRQKSDFGQRMPGRASRFSLIGPLGIAVSHSDDDPD
jgi:hypothetical protein